MAYKLWLKNHCIFKNFFIYSSSQQFKYKQLKQFSPSQYINMHQNHLKLKLEFVHRALNTCFRSYKKNSSPPENRAKRPESREYEYELQNNTIAIVKLNVDTRSSRNKPRDLTIVLNCSNRLYRVIGRSNIHSSDVTCEALRACVFASVWTGR